MPMTTLLLASLFALPQQLEKNPAQLLVSGPRVVFFSLSETERDSIARMEGLEIDDVLDDFNYTTGKVAVALHRRGITVDFTTAPVILVKLANGKVRRFERRQASDPVGMVLTDGVREPQFLPGMGTEQELLTTIQEFFGVKDQ